MYNLFEDEDDIFTGSPKSKFMDVMFHGSTGLAENELEKIMEEMAMMEMMLEDAGIADYENRMKSMRFERAADLEKRVKNQYIVAMGNILTQHE